MNALSLPPPAFSPGELAFLLALARRLCGEGFALAFVRTPEDLVLEVRPAYGPGVELRLVIDGPFWARSEGGACLCVSDVVHHVRQRLRARSLGRWADA